MPQDPHDRLPPIGEAGKEHVQLILSRREGIINALSLPLQIAAKCRRIAAWGEDVETPDDIKTVVNRIRLTVETQTANHLKEPTQVTAEPVETGEYARWYWCGPEEVVQELPPDVAPATDQMGQPVMDAMGNPAVTVKPFIDPIYIGGVGPDGEVFTPQPLPLMKVMQYQQFSQLNPDIFDPQFICKLNDEYTAKTLQKQFDQDWKDAKGDKWLRSRVYANTIEGWELPYYEFDQRTLKHLLRRNSIEQTYIDQSVEDIDDAAEGGIDLYLDLDEAISLYPEQREAILASNDTTQGPMTAPGAQGKVPTQFKGEFKRPMVRKVMWWMRNQPVGVQLAIDAGLIEERQIGSVGPSDTSSAAQGLGAEQPPSDGAILPGGSAEGSRNGETVLSEGGTGELPTGAGPGEGLLNPGIGLPLETVSAYFLPGTDTEVTPDSPDWPTALRQLAIIGEEIVEDIVCPLPDIPLGHMRNTLVVSRPWGIGEPFHTTNLQNLCTKITDDGAHYIHGSAFPAREMHAGLYQHLEQEYGRVHITAGSIISVPAEYWNPQTPFIRTIELPPFPQSNIDLLGMFNETFQELSGRPDVLSGKTPTPDASGRMVANLQAAAVEPLNFKAQEIAYMVEKIASLMLYARMKFTPIAMIAKTCSIPVPLMKLVVDRYFDRSPNLKVTVSTGAGAVIERKRQQYIQWNQLVDPADRTPIVDGQTTREILGVDPALVNRRNQQAIRNAAQVLAPLQAAAKPQEGQNGEGGEGGSEQHSGSSNGNGRMKTGRNGYE